MPVSWARPTVTPVRASITSCACPTRPPSGRPPAPHPQRVRVARSTCRASAVQVRLPPVPVGLRVTRPGRTRSPGPGRGLLPRCRAGSRRRWTPSTRSSLAASMSNVACSSRRCSSRPSAPITFSRSPWSSPPPTRPSRRPRTAPPGGQRRRHLPLQRPRSRPPDLPDRHREPRRHRHLRIPSEDPPIIPTPQPANPPHPPALSPPPPSPRYHRTTRTTPNTHSPNKHKRHTKTPSARHGPAGGRPRWRPARLFRLSARTPGKGRHRRRGRHRW